MAPRQTGIGISDTLMCQRGGPDIGSVRTAPNDVVIFRSVTSTMWSTPRDEIVDLMVKEIRQATASIPRPAFIWAWVLNWAWSMDKLQDVQARLGPEFVAVRPDVLAAMARAHAGEHVREGSAD